MLEGRCLLGDFKRGHLLDDCCLFGDSSGSHLLKGRFLLEGVTGGNNGCTNPGSRPLTGADADGTRGPLVGEVLVDLTVAIVIFIITNLGRREPLIDLTVTIVVDAVA